MAGLYIHIPFCKSRCIYCGFYSTTRLEQRQRYVDAVCREMSLAPALSRPSSGRLLPSDCEKDEPIRTVYLGGGTPSQLTEAQLRQLFLYINKVYGMEHVREVTMECNPDDVTPEFAETIAKFPVNRISMGVQTFSNERLRFLRRRHTAEQIPLAANLLRKAGIGNISIDLMYGFPTETLDDWHRDIDAALALNAEHLSAYCLMIEEGTPLFKLKDENEKLKTKDPRYIPIDEDTELQMYNDLIDRLTAAGYEHYEISNFAKKRREESEEWREESFRSLHNSNYWNQTPYIGLGAAAHSYNGRDYRRWNTDDLLQYIEGIESGRPVYEEEHLDDDTRYNDLLMTALRTSEGLCLIKLTAEQSAYCLQQAQRYLDTGLLTLQGHYLRLTRKGLFVSNMVMSDLMKADE